MKQKQVAISLPQEIIEQIRSKAAAENRSLSNYLAQLIQKKELEVLQ